MVVTLRGWAGFVASPSTTVPRMTQTEQVRTEVGYVVAEHIATITLDAPERMNTISATMLDELSARLLDADRDRDVRCIVLTGAGRAFCAGLDMSAQMN